MLHGVSNPSVHQAMEAVHPGLVAAGLQLLEDYNFDGIELVLPTTLFDTTYELDAAKRIEFGPYSEWRAPGRLYMNVERAYREFRNEAPDAPWDQAGTFDAIYELAKAKDVPPEF